MYCSVLYPSLSTATAVRTCRMNGPRRAEEIRAKYSSCCGERPSSVFLSFSLPPICLVGWPPPPPPLPPPPRLLHSSPHLLPSFPFRVSGRFPSPPPPFWATLCSAFCTGDFLPLTGWGHLCHRSREGKVSLDSGLFIL